MKLCFPTGRSFQSDSMKSHYVLTFATTSFAISAESAFKSLGLKNKTIPTPREISASCGLAIRFDEDILSEVKNLVHKEKIHPFELWRFAVGDEGQKATEKLESWKI